VRHLSCGSNETEQAGDTPQDHRHQGRPVDDPYRRRLTEQEPRAAAPYDGTVASHSEAIGYLSQLNENIREIAASAHEVLVEQGCESYVKTIYVGYDLGGEMAAALYGHADHVEIALALPEDAEGSLLVDASHLTWRTLPVAAIIRSADDVLAFAPLAVSACERVREASHDVMRDNDFFVSSRRARRQSRS